MTVTLSIPVIVMLSISAALFIDPHPDDTGLTEAQAHGVFIALEPWRMKP